MPIVLGGLSKGDYAKLAPPDSFIHVDDFNTTSDLAKYVNYLNTNPLEYNKYHAWRRKFSGDLFPVTFPFFYWLFLVLNEHGYFGAPILHYCRLCEALNYNSREEKVYQDLGRFWSSGADCRSKHY